MVCMSAASPKAWVGCMSQSTKSQPSSELVVTHGGYKTDHYCEVSGAGCARVNGRYYLDGSYEGRPRYKHERDEEDLYIRQGGLHFRGFGISPGREPIRGHWVYFCMTSHNQNDLMDVPHAADWVTHGGFGGLEPPPHVSVHRSVQRAAASCLVTGAGCSRMNGRYLLDGEYRGKPRYKHESEDDLYLRQGGKYRSGYGITAGRQTVAGPWAYFCVTSHDRADLLDVPDKAIWVTHQGFGAVDPPPEVTVEWCHGVDIPGLMSGAPKSIELVNASLRSCSASSSPCSTRTPSMEHDCDVPREVGDTRSSSLTPIPLTGDGCDDPAETEDAALSSVGDRQNLLEAEDTTYASCFSFSSKTMSMVSTVSPLQRQQPFKVENAMPDAPLCSHGLSPFSRAASLVSTVLPRVKRAVSPPACWQTWQRRDSVNHKRGRSVPPTGKISLEIVAQGTPCSKCDGPHEDSACPYFPLPRERHKDACTTPDKCGQAIHETDKPIVRSARVIPQPGIDGSCLFHSLAYGLGLRLSGWVLRGEICAFIEANPDIRLGDNTLREWILYDSDKSVSTYVEHILEGAWGGGIEMAVFSEMQQVNVHVYEKVQGGFLRISAFQHAFAEKTVTVLYRGRGHYDAIVL